jgi:N-acyl-L-homoserine lactone synthetase
MKIVTLNHCHFAQNFDLITAMYRLRLRIFRERLGWTVSSTGELEVDIFDTIGPTYLLVLDDAENVVGCVRLLSTAGPNMLARTFPALLEGKDAPCSARILESSRFCVDTSRSCELGASGLNRATFMLLAGMMETLRLQEADSIVTVTDTRMERVLRRAGWPLERIGLPQRLGPTMAVAGFLHGSDEALAAMYRNAGVSGPILIEPESFRAAA